MTKRKEIEIIEDGKHSFEDVLDVPSGTTEITKKVIKSEVSEHELYDDKDREIEEDFAEVQDKAFELYEYLFDEMDDADPGKRARLAEVAGQLLNTALSAGERRRVLKKHIDDLKHKKETAKGGKSGSGSTTNNIIISSQTELLRMLNKDTDDDSKVIDSNDYEHKEDE